MSTTHRNSGGWTARVPALAWTGPLVPTLLLTLLFTGVAEDARAAVGSEHEHPGQATALERAERLGYLEVPEDAIAEYEKILGGSPAPRMAQEAQMGIAGLEYARGELGRARKLFRKVLRQRPAWDLVKEATYRLKEIDRRLAWSGSVESRVAQCGVQALHSVVAARGAGEGDTEPVPIEEVARHVDTSGGTASLEDLQAAAGELGLRARGVRTNASQLEDLPKPLIAHLHPGHFVVVTESDDGDLRIVDPDLEAGTLPVERFRERWSGALLVFPEDSADVAAFGDGERIAASEMAEIRGGHHLHGKNLGGPCANHASAYHSGPSAINSSCSSGSCSPGLPNLMVNLANFNLLVQDTDFAYGGLGPSVLLQRTYNADDPTETVFGRSWSFNYQVALTEQANGDVDVKRGSGKEETFALLGCSGGTCTYDPPIWTHDELSKLPDGTFELRIQSSRRIQRFDATGRLTAIEDRNGNAVTLGYDGTGRLTAVTDAAGRGTTFSYGGDGKVNEVTDPAGRTATFAYDADGNLVETVDMAGNVVSYTYDTNSYMSSVTTPTGTWTITNVPYDQPEFGLVVESITDPLGHATTYSTPGLVVVEVEDPNGIVWQYYPVNDGELDRMTDPLGNTTEFDYDSDGDLTKVTDALGNVTRFSRDSRGNVTRITDPLGNQLDLSYDEDDNLTQLVDPLGNTSDYLYDGSSNLTQITDAAGGVTVFSYDALGQLTSFSDARANTTTFGYDADGNLTSMTTPLGKQTLYTHDAIGRPTSGTTPRGITRSFEWDGIDRLTKVTYPDASEVTYTYGCCQLESVTGPSGTLSFTYDGAGRPVSYTGVWSNTIGYGLDPGGRLTSLTYPDGKVVDYGYDDAGRLTTVTDWLDNVTTYRYDPLGRLTRTDLSNGSVALHAYDEASRLTKLTNIAPDGSILSRYDYTYDALGNRTHVDQVEPVPPSIPDETVTYQTDADNRLLTANAVTYGYDDDGNTISKTDGGQVTSYQYDDDGRLVQVDIGGQTTEYLYDDLGTTIGTVQDGTETRHVVNPLAKLSQLLIETDSLGNPLSYFIYGLGLQSRVTPGGQTYSYHFDLLGSAIGLTTQDGFLINRYGYRPYGQPFDGSSSPRSNPFVFVGRLGVAQQSSLTSMRARFYLNQTGRFLATDPIGLHGGPNGYTYGGNNPLRWIDPWGLWYGDVNLSYGTPWGVGVTGGMLISSSGLNPYLGGGIMSPGLSGSVTVSSSDASSGWNLALQSQFGLAIQSGISNALRPDRQSFLEVGVGWPPGASLTLFYVFEPLPIVLPWVSCN